MAITISGENNNDKILAQDGVIDQISGINIVGLITASHIDVGSNINLGNAGIVTATTFVGNLTGNVNSTSPLLLQTGGSERFRITGNNELGIAGANYGSSGQVLTSGGSGSAVTWSAIPTQVTISNNADNRVITGGSGTNLNGEANLTFDGSKLTVTSSSKDLLYLNSTHSSGPQLPFQTSGTTFAYIGSAISLFSTGSSTDLGFRAESGKHILFGIGANEKLRISSVGYVGINCTPESLFHVENDNAHSSHYWLNTDAAILVDNKNGSGKAVIKLEHDAALVYGSGSSTFIISDRENERLHIASNGNVRIGNGAPNLGVGSGLEIDTGGAATIRLEDSGAGSGFEIQNTGGVIKQRLYNNQPWTIEYGGGEKLRITSAGIIGIGTEAPYTNGLLHCDGHLVLTAAGNAPKIIFDEYGTGSDPKAQIEMDQESSTAASMRFYTEASGTLSEKLRITSTGRLGINNDSPQYVMHASHNGQGGNQRIDLHMTNDTTGHNSNDGVQFGYQNTAGAYIWNFEDNKIYFATNNTERFNIDKYGTTQVNSIRQRSFSPNTGSTNQYYWKIGSVTLNGSEGFILTFCGTGGYSNGQQIAGTTKVVARCSNASTLVGYKTASSIGAHVSIEDVRWKHEGSNVFSIWAQVQHYSQISPFVDFFGGALGGWMPENTSTGSTSAPSGSTAFSDWEYKQIAGVNTIQYTANDTYFLENIRMAQGKGIDFAAAADVGTGETVSTSVLRDYEEGTFSPTLYYGSGTSEASYNWRYGHYIKVGKQVTVWFALGITGFSASYSQAWIGGLPFQAADPNGQWKYLNHMMGYSYASGWGDGGSDKHMFLAIYDNQTKMMINHEGNHLSTGNIGSGQRFSCTVTYQTD